MDLITELENDIALAAMFERNRDADERDVRDLIANIHTALRSLSDAPKTAVFPKGDAEKERSQ